MGGDLGRADAGDGAGEAGEGAGGDEHALAGVDGGCVGVGYGAQIGGEQPYGVLEAAHVGVGDGGVGGCGRGGGAVAPCEVADVAEQGDDGRGTGAEKKGCRVARGGWRALFCARCVGQFLHGDSRWCRAGLRRRRWRPRGR